MLHFGRKLQQTDRIVFRRRRISNPRTPALRIARSCPAHCSGLEERTLGAGGVQITFARWGGISISRSCQVVPARPSTFAIVEIDGEKK